MSFGVDSTDHSLPKEWEGKIIPLSVKWEETQRKFSESLIERYGIYVDKKPLYMFANVYGYEASRFMFADGIVPLPSNFFEEEHKDLSLRAHIFINDVMDPSRDDSKRLPVFKDIAPN